MRWPYRLSAGFLAGLFGCSSEARLGANCTGVVQADDVEAGGVDLVPRSATAVYIFGGAMPVVQVSNGLDACAEFNAWSGDHCVSRTYLDIQFGSLPDGPRPGDNYEVTLQVEWNTTAIAELRRAPPAGGCIEHPGDVDDLFDRVHAVSGSVRVDDFEKLHHLAGRYELVFEDGATASGSFDTPFCRADNSCEDRTVEP